MKNTKEKILEAALNLFLQKGFAAVSIRDICKEMTIKESTVYYHFENKQAIFDILLERFRSIGNEMMNGLEMEIADGFDVVNENFYRNLCEWFFEKYLMDDFCNKVIRLLSIEQFHNADVQKIYTDWLLERPVQFQGKMLDILMKEGVIEECDSRLLAIRFYAPIYFFAQRWLFSGSLTEENKQRFRENAFLQVENFFKEILQ